MSVINKMLQELDRRHAPAGAPGHARHPEVRAVPARPARQEWFWRVVAALMLVAAAWTGWVVFQLRPYSLATDLAFRAAVNSQRQAPAAAVEAVAAPAVLVPAQAAAAPAPEQLAAPMETLRLALTIDTPLAPRPAARPAARKVADAAPPKPKSVAAAASAPARIEKRDRDGPPVERAESEFRRAALLLERGRVADAEDALRRALQADPSHRPARQTLIALHIEQGRIEDARRHLQEGLALHPGYAPYAVALARIYVDRGEHLPALDVLDAARTGGQDSADYHAMRGAILLRMGRHGEAADAYRAALNVGTQSGASWIGLGVSLDASGRGAEAAEAFRRGIANGALTDDLRAYAEQRIRQLQ